MLFPACYYILKLIQIQGFEEARIRIRLCWIVESESSGIPCCHRTSIQYNIMHMVPNHVNIDLKSFHSSEHIQMQTNALKRSKAQ